jgi:DNA polymerase-3 subunit epsilon
VRQRVHELLLGRPHGAVPGELLKLVFVDGHRHDGRVGRGFLDTLLGGDPRFRFDPAQARWFASDDQLLDLPLASAPFVVVDLETTGGAPAASGITEIGAVRVRGGRLEETFVTLVNPGRPIPPFVIGLTGITNDMVADAPPIATALPRFLAFAGRSVLVAHNAAFDVGHLTAARLHLDGQTLDLPSLCTLRLARRLLPELRRRGLDAVASELGISCTDRHRALADARIAAEVFCVFLERAEQRGLRTVADVLRFQRLAADGRPLVVNVPRERVDALPLEPGVYRLLGADGRVLYVGRARRLRERVGSYFRDDADHDRRTLSLVRRTHDVDVTETGSELAAALLEAQQIRDLRPRYNRLRGHLPRVWFVKLAERQVYTRLTVTTQLGLDRALYVGPFGSREQADGARALCGRAFGLRVCRGRADGPQATVPCVHGDAGPCSAPCARAIGPDLYRGRVEAFRAFVEGGGEAPTRIGESEAEELEALRRHQRKVGWIANRRHFLVLLPAPEPETAHFYAVMGGRVAVDARLGSTADFVAALRLVVERWEHYRAMPIARADVERMTIVAAWLRDRAEKGVLLPFDRLEEIEGRLDELTVTVNDFGLRGPMPPIDALR